MVSRYSSPYICPFSALSFRTLCTFSSDLVFVHEYLLAEELLRSIHISTYFDASRQLHDMFAQAISADALVREQPLGIGQRESEQIKMKEGMESARRCVTAPSCSVTDPVTFREKVSGELIDISDCSPSEITVSGKIEPDGRGVCSLQCIAALSTVNNNLLSACTGVQASPNTLIGLFFAQKGVSYLCPNSVMGNGPAPSSTGVESTAAETSTSSSSTSSPSSSSSSSLSSEPSTTTTTSSSSTTESSQSSITSAPSPSFQPTTAVDKGVATVLTSEAQRSDSSKSNPEAFGGGGSPFEVAANGAVPGRVRNSVPVMLCAATFWSVMAGCWLLVGG
ncbi:hypothetical protein GJ744_010081 [Endocarpon pusillum]|uniref:Uncharacterized protein n=1 Tax=Endocarpon pusillum TaxID=364733 RepID=A0A8H7AET4_9EURO|nr:hypothetical protein GJ744_010081 [Endocarpon pusillum]